MSAAPVGGPAAPPGADHRRRGHAAHGRSARGREERRAGLALISPTVIIVCALVVLPILWTVLLAFQQIPLLRLRTAGILGSYTLENFATVFGSAGFLDALRTTFVYSLLGSGGAIVIGLIATLALRRPFPGRGFVRAAMLLPYVAPVVAVTFVWRTALNPQFGIVNAWGQSLGWDDPIAFLSQRSLEIAPLGLTLTVPIALLTVIAFEWWRSFPFAFLFLTARLNAVPGTMEEAARVDGATVWQRFWYIVLPQLLPTIAVLSVLRFIWTFNSFDDIWLLTNGGAGTEVVAVRVYDFLTARGDIGAASAQALVLAAILAISVGLLLKRFRTREETS